MRRAVAVALLVLSLAAVAVLAAAEPQRSATVCVVDQDGRAFMGADAEAVGAKLARASGNCWHVEASGQYILRVKLYNITVFQGALEAGKDYTVKCAVTTMNIYTPSPDIKVEVELVGVGKKWVLAGQKTYRLWPMPAATYRIVAHGATTLEKVVYFSGGEIRLEQSRISPSLIPLIALAVIPITAGVVYDRMRKAGKHPPEIKVPSLKVPRPSLKKRGERGKPRRSRPPKMGERAARARRTVKKKEERREGKEKKEREKKRPRRDLAEILDSIPE